MTTINPPIPASFTNDDFAARMSRVASSAAEKDLAGVIVTPGPDLVWLIGYRPTAITERLTMLVLSGQRADPGCPCPRAAGRRGCRGRGQRLNRGLGRRHRPL